MGAASEDGINSAGTRRACPHGMGRGVGGVLSKGLLAVLLLSAAGALPLELMHDSAEYQPSADALTDGQEGSAHAAPASAAAAQALEPPEGSWAREAGVGAATQGPRDASAGQGGDTIAEPLTNKHHKHHKHHKKASGHYTAEAWVPPRAFPGFEFPEEAAAAGLRNRSNSALCFSGGGLRSFIASVGYLSALHGLGLLQEARYTSAVSGGAWATVMYSFYARGADGVAESDEELLGRTPFPQDITMQALEEMSETRALGAATSGLLRQILREVIIAITSLPLFDLGRVWRDAIAAVFLHPYGIRNGVPFTWDAESARKIAKRNVGVLKEKDFALANAGVPFPIVGFGLLGPSDMVPFQEPRSYTMMEATPLYIGAALVQNVTFHSKKWCSHRRGRGRCSAWSSTKETLLIGGLIAPFAFGGRKPPTSGVPPGEERGLVDVPAPTHPFSLREVAGSSSYAPGGYFASSSLLPLLGQWIGIHFDYWSPAAPSPATTPVVMADGGDIESPHIIGPLLRGVTSLVVFLNFNTPLATRAAWDPYERPPTVKDIDDDLPPFFGMVLDDWGEANAYDFSRNQVFAAQDFPWVVAALQEAQAGGRGVVATTELETVANAWWGLQGGLRVNVTWVYLSRATAWEADLPADLRALVVPRGGGGDPTLPRAGGPFSGFPYYSTGKLTYDARNANLLAFLSGWVVLNHADTITAAVRGAPLRTARRPAGPQGRAGGAESR